MAKRCKELIDLWITVAIMLSLSAYHLMVSLNEAFYEFLHLTPNFPGRELLSHGLYIWMLGLLFIAYQRWKSVGERESELTAIMDSTGPAVVLVVNPQRKINSCNGSIEHVFGYTPEEVVGQTTDLLYGDRRASEQFPNEIYDTLKQVGFHIGEAQGMHKSGDALDLEIITVEKKSERGAVLLVKDITSRKHSERLLLAAKEEAEYVTQEKQVLLDKLEQNFARLQKLESSRDTLTHMIVHDMKTPLQVLTLNAELLRETMGLKLEKSDMKSIDDISSYCTQLDIMMKSMLDASRMEEERLPIDRLPQDLSDTVGDAVQMLGTIKAAHSFILVNAETLPVVAFDQELIQRVLMNLFVNAIKYSPKGSIIRIGFDSRPHDIKISISDQGQGIPQEKLPMIFEKFTQVNEKGQRPSGSTGLGLTFCRLAVEAHGGEVGVESTEGEGSTFWFTLPQQAVETIA